MNDEIGAAEAGIPRFTGDDIVRLFAGSYLPLCRTLRAARMIDPQALAARILDRLGPEREAAWAILAMSLVNVLLRDAEQQPF